MKAIRALLVQASGLMFAGLAFAAPQHAVTLYNEPPKYPANFKYFDYVNPDAPKGGMFRQAGFGGFDSLNPFISKGVRPTISGKSTTPWPNTVWMNLSPNTV
jgi:microcin C transport system substrate-binding protein